MKPQKKGLLSRYDWRRLFKRHIAVAAVFLVMSWVFMGRSLTSCQNTVIGSPGGGDHVAGIIWLFTFTNKPYGGVSHVTNYPFGQNVAQPQLITSAANMVPTWALSKVVGPYCSWNLMVLAGYMSSALLMYGFIYWLLRHRGIALFAGLAVAFTPYHYFKTYGHLSYTQSGLFVALLWAFLWFWKAPTRKKGIFLGILTGLLFYSDGYFPLIGGTMLGSLVFYAVITSLIGKQQKTRLFRERIRYLLISFLTTFVLLLPIAFVQVKYGARIHASIESSRSNVIDEIERYGARAADYVVPSELQPFPPMRKLADNYRFHHSYSNPGEYTLYLGITVLALSVYALYEIFLRRHSAKKEDAHYRWIVGALAFITLSTVLLSFLPYFKIAGYRILLPSDVLGHLTSLWRVYARLYLAVNIAVVSLAAVGLWYARGRIKNPRYRAALIATATILMLLDLMPFNPLSRHDEQSTKNAYPTYLWLRDNKDIKAIAAYPLLEYPFGTSYFGDQVVHRKPMLNNSNSSDTEVLLHRALMGLGDGQTPGVLRGLGINDVLLYRINFDNEASVLTPLYGDFGARLDHINATVAPLSHVLVPGAEFNVPSVDPLTQISCRQPLVPSATLVVRDLSPPLASDVHIHFVLRGQPGQSLIISYGSSVLETVTFTSKGELRPVDLTVSDDQLITIYHLSLAASGFAEVCNLTTDR